MLSGRASRRTLVIGAAMTAVLGLAGCATGGPSGGSSGGSSAITVSTSANSGRPGLEAIAPLYQKATGVKVTTQFGQLGTPTYTSQLQTQLQGGTAPDVFGAFPGSGTSAPNLGTLAKAGNALDLSDTQWAKNLPDSVKPAVTVNGKVYAAVLGLQFGAVIYNTELFDKYKLTTPKTFGEMTALVKKIRQVSPSSTPIALAGSNAAVGMIVASMAAVNVPGTSYSSTDYTSSAAWRGGLQQFADLQSAGAFAKSASTDDTNGIISQMTTGKAFMILDVTSRYAAIKGVDKSAPISMFPYPAANATDTRLLIWPGTTLVGNARSSNTAGAKKFIDYVTATKNDSTWTQAAGGAEFPPTQLGTPSAWPSQFKPLSSASANTVLIPAMTWPNGDIGTALGTDVSGLLAGTKTVNDVLSDMDAAK